MRSMRNIINAVSIVENARQTLDTLSKVDKLPSVIKKQIDEITSVWDSLPDNVREIVVDALKQKIEEINAQKQQTERESIRLDSSTLEHIASEIKKIESVRNATFWNKIPGKEAVYIDLKYVNMRGEIRPGSGGKFIFTSTGKLKGAYKDNPKSTWACDENNADYHIDSKTIENIKAVISSFDSRLPVE